MISTNCEKQCQFQILLKNVAYCPIVVDNKEFNKNWMALTICVGKVYALWFVYA